MPAIAHRAPSSPPPTAAATSGDCTPQKRKLRSDSVSTPMKWTDDGIESETFESVRKLRRSPAKDLMSSFTASQSWNARDSEQMMAVKEALHVSTAPTVVVCREDEQKKVFEFCKSGVENEKPGSLYICGCPGTGKSLSVEKVKMSLVDWAQQAGIQEPDVFTVNCTTLTNTSDIFVKILGQIQPNKRSKGSISALQLLQKLYSQKPQSSTKKMMLVIADELDYLITRDRAVLHDLFMLTTLPFSRCILIGIANAIDLADRFLPRLQSLNCKPTVITFRAYSYDQILKILQERLLELPYSVFQLQALELCARKVAGASGDMRKALCVCRSAIEMLEAELKEYSDSSDISIEERTLERLANRDAHTINRKDSDIVRIDHMALALSKTYKSPVVDTIQSLPQHQQIILCAAVKLFRGGKKDTTIGELNKSYVGICKTTLIPAVGISELSNMCMVLKDQGLLKLGQYRDEKLKRVTLKIDETDITFALQGIRFFRSCLQFESCLLKMFSFYFTRVKTRCECLGETQTQESSPPTRKRNGRTNKELSIF